MAETLRQRIETLRDECRNKMHDAARITPDGRSDARHWFAQLTAALALPDDPRDLALRAFADSMTPEKCGLLKGACERERVWHLECQLEGPTTEDKRRAQALAEIAASVEALCHE